MCLQVKIIQHHNLFDIKVRPRYSEVTVLRFVFISWTVWQRAAHRCVFYILGIVIEGKYVMPLDVETEPFIEPCRSQRNEVNYSNSSCAD